MSRGQVINFAERAAGRAPEVKTWTRETMPTGDNLFSSLIRKHRGAEVIPMKKKVKEAPTKQVLTGIKEAYYLGKQAALYDARWGIKR